MRCGGIDGPPARMTVLTIDGSLHRRAGQVGQDQGGSGMEEADKLAAPINAVQLVFASIGAPGNR